MNRERKEGQMEKEIKLTESEYRLMEIIWEKEPIAAMDLAGVCLDKFDWKKSTVYTMLKRMGDKGILLFEEKMVTSIVKKEQVDRSESNALLMRSFRGSVPDFFAAFLQDRRLTKEEAEKIRKMIEEASE